MAHTPYRNGNRLAVPNLVAGPHFLYKPETPKVTAAIQADLTRLSQLVIKYVEDHGLHTSEIGLVPKSYVRTHGHTDVFERLAEHFFGEVAHLADPTTCDILVCEQALPHCDDSFEGTTFLSAVVHTGPEPYILQTFHSRKRNEAFGLDLNTRLLHVGERFVLDPTTPHMAVPQHSNDKALLVLLQLELKEHDESDRLSIVSAVRPAEADANIHDLSLL